ncbi:mid region of cactin-domain-containing protein [Geopyxis carbonaria]|nr:mid region of cactin-domain-containing protein [Geopyxis carbonaria]
MDYTHPSRKRTRSRSRSPPPWRNPARSRPPPSSSSNHTHPDSHRAQKEQTRLNALQEAEQARVWVSQEDEFVLKQAKRKAEIRVKEGRAKPIDFLAVTLRVIDGAAPRDPLDDEIADEDLDVVDPEGILSGLSAPELEELAAEVDVYLSLETRAANAAFWRTMKVLTADRLSRLSTSGASGDGSRAVGSVAADVDKLLSSKTLSELEALEPQIAKKLASNEPIDVDYWAELLRSLRIWKAKASLRVTYSQVIARRLATLRAQQADEAAAVRAKLEDILAAAPAARAPAPPPYSRAADPEPLLKLHYDDKALATQPEAAFLAALAADRRRVANLGYVPHKPARTPAPAASTALTAATMPPPPPPASTGPRFASVSTDDFSAATAALYEREVARGVSDNEEIFTGEEELPPSSAASASVSVEPRHRPRKPRYFNRVQMGYEWNKYNQTHYDHDNPPPKVVQGYKFNIFYPDLIDKSRAPTYRIEREGGRRRGQSFAPAGEEDTCLIRFIAGPPYEDVAFRIVDKEWDYSAKRERGFRSSFEKGILQLHFQLKKIYYRK